MHQKLLLHKAQHIVLAQKSRYYMLCFCYLWANITSVETKKFTAKEMLMFGGIDDEFTNCN
ncbi:MAG: hypothetical protein DUD32_12385 [Lactobacillus sp.]|nr:MAG: hypothetical protein DUD32_12385 [Lactobacillus sp.]